MLTMFKTIKLTHSEIVNCVSAHLYMITLFFLPEEVLNLS